MLWDQYGDKADQLYKSWYTFAKMGWGVPRSTHTFLLNNLLVDQFFTVKQQLVGRYVNFVRWLLKSTSPEISIVSNMVPRCARSPTGKNLINIARETGLEPWTSQSWKVRAAVRQKEVPDGGGWSVQYLGKLLDARMDINIRYEVLEEINTIIKSLCSS